MNEQPIIIVQGGQFGSEGKGMVAAALCLERDVDIAVRTGSVNAGHTVYYDGAAHKMQQLPTGWVNPGTSLMIGAGAYINPGILYREIHEIAAATKEPVSEVISRISIDYRCGVHLIEHTDRSAISGRHHLMGATGKGCSEAIVDKIRLRGQADQVLTFSDWMKQANKRGEDIDWIPELIDVEHELNAAYDNGEQILIEGTQGTLLDLHLGPYPYVTHKQTTVASWLSECGLSPNLKYEVILCLRTYPIRVAGNSGPLPGETAWEILAATINARLYDMARRGNQERSAACKEIVPQYALVHWRDVQTAVASEPEWKDKLPIRRVGSDKYGFMVADYDFPSWNQEYRIKYCEALSEFHAVAFKRLPYDVQGDLRQLFEFTTVTGKLRRIADFNIADAVVAIRQARPDSICLTFLNYWYPELWDRTWVDVISNIDAMSAIDNLSQDLDVSISYVTIGAKSEHFINIERVPDHIIKVAKEMAEKSMMDKVQEELDNGETEEAAQKKEDISGMPDPPDLPEAS